MDGPRFQIEAIKIELLLFENYTPAGSHNLRIKKLGVGFAKNQFKALQLRRAHLGLSKSTPALLICDAFTGNFAFRCNEDERRERWGIENNCHLPIKPSGGWSAHGQPCDAWHCHFRRLCNQYIDSVLGYSEKALHRIAAPAVLGASQQKHLQVGVADAIKGLVYGWQEMKRYPALLCWAWTSRGLVTKEEMVKMRPEVCGPDPDPKDPTPAFHDLIPGIPLLTPSTAIF